MLTLSLPGMRAAVPATPSDLQAYVVGSDRVYLTWTDTSPDEYGFQIDIGTVASGTFDPHKLVVSSSTQVPETGATQGAYTNVVDAVSGNQLNSLLTAGVSYQARVRAYNYLGAGGSLQFSAASPAVTFTTLSPATFNVPAGLQVVSSQATRIRLGWTDNATIEDGYGYNFSINGLSQEGLWGLTGVNGTTGDFRSIGSTTIAPGTTYAIQVWGHRTVGGALSITGGGTAANPVVTVTTTSEQTFDPPAGFTGSLAGDAGFQLSWTDNSTTEDTFDIQFREGTSGTMALLEQVPWNTTSTDIGGAVGKPNTTYQFQVRASKTTGSTTESTAWVGAPLSLTTTFSAPSNLVATAPDETHVNLTWTDNSNAETDYEVQYFDPGLGGFTTFNYYPANATSVLNIATGTPATVRFRVRATYGAGPDIFSDFSNEATITTFRGPANLVASSVNETSVNLAWTDNSAVESKYLVLGRVAGATEWAVLATLAADATSHSVTDLPPGTGLEFAVLAAVTSSLHDIESPLSNVAAVTTPFAAATSFTATPLSDRRIELSWADNSAAETGYAVLCKQASDSQFRTCATLGANTVSFVAKAEDSDFNFPFLPDTEYDFLVFAFAGSSETAGVSTAATTKDGTSSDLSPPLFVNEAFSHPFLFTTGQGTVDSVAMTGALPPGVSFDPATLTLSGIPSVRGAFTPTLEVTWTNGWSAAYTVHLRPVHRPGRPVASGVIPGQAFTLGEQVTASIPLAAFCSDPDAESAVRLDIPAADGTPAGRSITVILNDSVTPQTVANFLAYLNDASNGYTDTVFHRLVPGFILQGGAYKSSTAQGVAPNAFVSVPKLPAVANEPGISNVAGTIAMAKQAGNPDSATTDFFFNLADNGANLDFQNEGFTVFGRVNTPSLALLTGILNHLPLPPDSGDVNAPNYAVTVDGVSTFFAALPSNTPEASSPAEIDPALLLRVNGMATNIPLVTYSVAGNTNSAAVSASLNGTNLELHAQAPGTATISVQATDLDGNTLLSPLSFSVSVTEPFASWSSGQGLPAGLDGPADDADADGSSNLEEFAFLTDPLDGSQFTRPAPAIETDRGGVTFKVRKFTNLTYTVEGSGDLIEWTAIWTTPEGFGAANVASAEEHPGYTLVTVRDPAPFSPSGGRFLRVKLTSPAG